jgi:hypothetical protein
MAHAAAAGGWFRNVTRKRATDSEGQVRPHRWYEKPLVLAALTPVIALVAISVVKFAWSGSINLTTRGERYRTEICSLHRADSTERAERISDRDTVLRVLNKVAVDIAYMRGRQAGAAGRYAGDERRRYSYPDSTE